MSRIVIPRGELDIDWPSLLWGLWAKDAVSDAAAKVERLDVYDFEQIVFQSSYKEGVWESDVAQFCKEGTET